MKLLYVFVVIFAAASAQQRPSFAGSSPKGVPELASRFKDDSPSDSVNVANRIGAGSPDQNVPVDGVSDVNVVNRVKSWPKENQPFWLLNSQQIEKHINIPERSGNQQEVIQNRHSGYSDDDYHPKRPVSRSYGSYRR